MQSEGITVLVDASPQATTSLMSYRRRLANILGLSMGWCLMVSVMFLQISSSTLAARDYAGAATATLPPGIMMAAATLAAPPGTLAMQRYGRRPILITTAAAAVAGGVATIIAARVRALWLLILGSIPLGVAFAQANNLRFAALEFAPACQEQQALSAVVMGAVLAAVVGPEVGRHTRHSLAIPYLGTYIFLTGLCVLYGVLMAVVEFGATQGLAAEKVAAAAAEANEVADKEAGSKQAALQPPEKEQSLAAAEVKIQSAESAYGKNGPLDFAVRGEDIGKAVASPTAGAASAGSDTGMDDGDDEKGDGSWRSYPLVRLLRRPDYAVPVATAALTYGGMAAVMNATPLAMEDSGNSFSQVTQVIQVHILSMFIPSFFTGDVVRWLGPRPTMALGTALLAAGTALLLRGATLPLYFAANSVVGVGWNWAYVGASVLVAGSYRPSEKFLAQGVMDSFVLGATGAAVVAAGGLYSGLGWRRYAGLYVGLDAGAVVAAVALLLVRGRG